jgi:hypothetical protein
LFSGDKAEGKGQKAEERKDLGKQGVIKADLE